MTKLHRLPLLLSLLLVFATGCEAQTVHETPGDADGRAASETAPSDAAARPVAWQVPVPDPDPETLRLFDRTMAYARDNDLAARPLGEVMVAIGRRFEGTSYAAGLLDKTPEEELVCSLNGFDCVTFVETTLAMARGIKAGEYDFDAFARRIRDQRYRDGRMDGYCSRLHYFSEWISDNEARGNVQDITREAGGERLPKTINFMSSHRDAYPRFAKDDTLYECIQQMEAGLANLELFYIPQDRIHEAYDQLRSGDIIATATNIKGLDVTHTGLVYKTENGTGFLHASTSGGVKVSPDLQRYVQNIDKQIGIVVARPTASR